MIRLQEWAAQIADCTQSGKTVREWCRENIINEKTYYHRMRVVREEMLELIETWGGGVTPGLVRTANEQVLAYPEGHGNYERHSAKQQEERPVFAALSRPQVKNAAITVRVGEYAVDIPTGADDEMVEQVLRVVAKL
jgi:hypothetical protein